MEISKTRPRGCAVGTKKKIFLALAVLAAGVLAAVLLNSLVWRGIILLNNPSGKTYPVRGVDVSHYQGEIDWEILSSQNVDFAFIKATEGSTFTDDRSLLSMRCIILLARAMRRAA